MPPTREYQPVHQANGNKRKQTLMSNTKPIIVWSSYPYERAGCYAHCENMILSAHPSGTWNTWEKPTPWPAKIRGSEHDLIPAEEQNLDSAKRNAEKAAYEILEERAYEEAKKKAGS